MRKSIRSPLTWLVVAEFIVVAALIAVAWNAVNGAMRPATAASPGLSLPAPSTEAGAPLPDIPETGRPGLRGPLPGLNLDSAFWRERLQELNRDQALFEQLEWRIVHAAIDALHRYLETVVLPAIQHAEHAGGAVVL